MKVIAVTGVNGYIGSSVARQLLESGYSIIGLSIEDKSIIEHPDYLYIQVDLTNWKKVQSIFLEKDIDMLLHFAGIAHVIKGQEISDEMYKRINYLAAKNLFTCAYSNNTRVFFASSIDVYGACKERLWSEDVLPKPVSMYGKSKYMAECSLQEIFKERSESYLIGRFAPVYSNDHMKDANKRIYIKYPKLALVLGSKPEYTLLALKNLVSFVNWWVQGGKIEKNIINVCDESGIMAEKLIQLEKGEGRANRIIWIPKFLARIFTWLANKLLYSASKKELGFALTKLFDPRILNKAQITSTHCCYEGITEIIYGKLDIDNERQI